MKHSARLMLFVALLLPLRGALAVSGWLCHMESPAPTATAYVQHAMNAASPADVVDPVVEHAVCHGAGERADQADKAKSHNPSCNVCSSICGAPAFPSADAQFRGLPAPGAERFDAIALPRAEFALGGLERPPRTI